MSSKSKESPASSSQASSSASQSRSNSPLSQAFRRRKEEKVELQNLTYRLANYIDAVRQLVSENNRLNLQITTTQDENNRLNLQITTTQDTFSREMTSVIGKYEKELSATRQLLDETAKEKARLKLDAGQSREMTSVIGKYEKELSDTRQLLDETAEEKGKLQLDAGWSRAELGELTQK
jgi:lamin B